MVSQEDMEEMRQSMLLEAKEREQYECMMSNIDCFMESDVVAEAITKLKEIKELCKMYNHDFSEVVDGMKDIV